MLEKEEKLSALFKKTSKIMCEYEKETTEMVDLLHKTRDEQVQIMEVTSCAWVKNFDVATKSISLHLLIFCFKEIKINNWFLRFIVLVLFQAVLFSIFAFSNLYFNIFYT